MALSTGSIPSGADQYATWKIESTFATTPTGSAKSFGHDLKLTTAHAKNNGILMKGLGNQEATATVGGKFEGSITMDFILGDPWMFSFITGQTSTAGGAGPYTHTWTSILTTMLPFEVAYASNTATAHVRTFFGCVFDSLTMDLNVGDPIKCTLNANYATEALTTTFGSNTNPTDAPFTFAYASVAFPTGTSITTPIQSLNLTLGRNGEVIYGLGSRIGTNMVTKDSDYTGKATVALLNSADFYQYFLGSSSATAPAAVITEPAGLVLTCDNGLSTTSSRKLVMTFTGAFVNEYGQPASVDDFAHQEVSFLLRKLASVVGTDNTATEP